MAGRCGLVGTEGFSQEELREALSRAIRTQGTVPVQGARFEVKQDPQTGLCWDGEKLFLPEGRGE